MFGIRHNTVQLLAGLRIKDSDLKKVEEDIGDRNVYNDPVIKNRLREISYFVSSYSAEIYMKQLSDGDSEELQMLTKFADSLRNRINIAFDRVNYNFIDEEDLLSDIISEEEEEEEDYSSYEDI